MLADSALAAFGRGMNTNNNNKKKSWLSSLPDARMFIQGITSIVSVTSASTHDTNCYLYFTKEKLNRLSVCVEDTKNIRA